MGLSVGQRLLLGLAPSLLAVVLVLVLAYYGEFGRQAPGYVVAGAALLSVASLVLTWSNTRYLALRIRRLAGGVERSRSPFRDLPAEDDELGRIEQVVQKLGDALATSEADRRQSLAAAAVRRQQQATMLGASVRDALAQLDDVRLPLHILIEAPFGELNENQEELIVTARAAADAMDLALRRLSLSMDVDRDAINVLLERVAVNDVVRGVLPMLRASAERHGIRLQATLDPLLPRVTADRARLAEALALLGTECAREPAAHPAMPDAELPPMEVATRVRDDMVEVFLSRPFPASPSESTELLLAERLLEAQGGRLQRSLQALSVLLRPSEPPVRAEAT